jgi:glycosyltransferase involved in cell wall biosynthesis
VRRRRVLFLTASYPTPDGPALGVFVQEHARAAAEHCEVAVVHLDRDDVSRLHVEERRGEEFFTLRIRYPRSPTPLSYGANIVAGAVGLRHMRARGFRPDVLHAHFFLAAVPAVALRPLHRAPVVVTEQWSVFLPSDPAELSPAVRRAAKFALEHAEVVMPVSEALRDGIRAAGIDARFHVVPNVFDPGVFHPPAVTAARNGRPARVLAVGAFYHAKGYEFLLEASALLARERRDFHVDIVGIGELQQVYEDQRAQLGLEELVSFRGLRPKAEVAQMMRDADVFVLTSRYDSNPCAAIEALGSGLPVVATAVGGLPEMVRDGMGLLAEPENPASIAQRLAEVLDGTAVFDREAIAERARERYGREHVGDELLAVYEQALALRAAHRR